MMNLMMLTVRLEMSVPLDSSFIISHSSFINMVYRNN